MIPWFIFFLCPNVSGEGRRPAAGMRTLNRLVSRLNFLRSPFVFGSFLDGLTHALTNFWHEFFAMPDSLHLYQANGKPHFRRGAT